MSSKQNQPVYFLVAPRTGGDRQLWCLNMDGSLESRCGAFAEVFEGDEGKLQVNEKYKLKQTVMRKDQSNLTVLTFVGGNLYLF